MEKKQPQTVQFDNTNVIFTLAAFPHPDQTKKQLGIHVNEKLLPLVRQDTHAGVRVVADVLSLVSDQDPEKMQNVLDMVTKLVETTIPVGVKSVEFGAQKGSKIH